MAKTKWICQAMKEMVWNYAKWSANFWPRVEWLCKWPKKKI